MNVPTPATDSHSDPRGTPPFASDEARLAAIRRRDPAADGTFVFSVRTTGVYCRPSCAARPARRDNIVFHASCAEAEAAGFRPCKRCRPDGASLDQRHAAAVARACRRIERAATPPTLVTLAADAGLSPFHFHRVFRAVTGVTPKGYAAAHRAARLAAGLRTAASVTEAIYAAGFNAPSRAAAAGRLGMTPTRFRDGGAGVTIHVATSACSLGTVLVAATDRGLCAILLGDDADALRADLRVRFPRAMLEDGGPGFTSTVAAAVALVETPARAHALPLDIGGTAFQQQVWEALRAIPAGETASYAAIAASIGQPRAVRAVAAACAANALAVAIPCHRVLRGDGSLSGYRWGVERKRALLAAEAAIVARRSDKPRAQRGGDGDGDPA